MSRLKSIWFLLSYAFSHYPKTTSVFGLLALADALLPVAAAALTGALIGKAVTGASFVTVLAGIAIIEILPIGEIRWRLAEGIGLSTANHLDRRVMSAVLGPATVAHLEDAEVQNAISKAADTWNDSIFEGITNVLITRLTGIGSALLAARYAGWPSALSLACAWYIAGRWSSSRNRLSLDIHFDQMPTVRRAKNATRVGMGAEAAKEVRIFGLADWIALRYLRLWTQAMSEIWAERRRGIPISILVAIGVSVVHLLAFWNLANAGFTAGRLALAAQAILGIAQIGSGAFGAYEMEYGLRVVPANKELARLVGEPRFQASGTEDPAGMPNTAIELSRLSFGYPGSAQLALKALDLTLTSGESMAIVGDNGAGKTTLVKLLCRFYEPDTDA